LSYCTVAWQFARIQLTRRILLLQDALTAVYKWANKWQLSVSVEKCYILSLGKATNQVVLSIGNSVLPVVQSCRYLGITMTHDLSFSEHINNMVFKAHQRANAILRCFVSRNITIQYNTKFVKRHVAVASEAFYFVHIWFMSGLF